MTLCTNITIIFYHGWTNGPLFSVLLGKGRRRSWFNFYPFSTTNQLGKVQMLYIISF